MRSDYRDSDDVFISGVPTDEVGERITVGYYILQDGGEQAINYIQVDNPGILFLDKYYTGDDVSKLLFDLTGMPDINNGKHLMFYDDNNFFVLDKYEAHGYSICIRKGENYLFVSVFDNIILNVQLGKKDTPAEKNIQTRYSF